MDEDKMLKRYANRVGYGDEELAQFQEGEQRLRQIKALSQVAARYSLVTEVIKVRHCNSGYKVGDRFVLNVDGNFLTKLCPSRLCVY